LYIVKIFDDNGLWANGSDLIDAANRCANAGANVISMSLSGTRKMKTEERAFDSLYNQGVLSVAAASNEGTTTLHYPASYASVISVGALDETLTWADFSNYNSAVELSAPGVHVLSTVPYLDIADLTVDSVTYHGYPIEYAALGSVSGTLVDGGLCTSTGAWSGKVVLCQRGDISFYDKVMNVQNSGGVAAVIYNNAPGNFLGTLGEGYSSTIPAISLSQEDGQYLVANKLGKLGNLVSQHYWPVNDNYEYYDGTSMATPHVSAVAALIWSANPTWTNAQIRTALQNTALDLGAAGRDVYYGYGLVQAYAACLYLGCGPTNNPPTVAITAPANGSTFTSGAAITFSGSASDAEDGNLTSNLVWTSSLDGQIGTGGSFTAALSDGTHTITASVTDSGGQAGSASITLTVGGGGGALSVTVTTDKTTYSDRQNVLITVTVTDGTNPVQGASVNVTLTDAKGVVKVYTGTTGTDGKVTFSYRINIRKGGTGTYMLNATATKSGYLDGSGSTTFLVQ
jgi:subtilisin family serine protease